MRRSRASFAVVAAAGLLWVSAAQAHLLKLFATVEDGAITGFAFFVGGGRPEGASVVVRDGRGEAVANLTTTPDGRFSWSPPGPQRYTITVDAGDGHIAEATIGPERFTGALAAVSAGATGGADAAAPTAGTQTNAGMGTAGSDPAALDAIVQRAVDRAVERQVRPLLEAYAQAENRVRFNDVMGGIGMIIGLAGIALWASARRRGGGSSS